MIYRSPISYGVNTCHAPVMLRKDLLDHLAFLKQYCGFRFARCHGILNDTIHVASRSGDDSQPNPVWAMVDGQSDIWKKVREPKGKLHFHFEQAHNVYGNLLEIGYTPLVELSFLPAVLAADPQHRCCFYKGYCSQPKSYKEWGELIESFGHSMVARFGLAEVSRWRFTVWNEPNGGFWFPKGDRYPAYLKLYEAAARALKRVSSRLEVGGPATMVAGWAPPGTVLAKGDPMGRGGPLDGEGWVESFIRHCIAKKVPLDFIETHLYPMDEYEILKEKTRELFGPFEYFPNTIRKVNAAAARLLPGKDIIWGEWSSNHRVVRKDMPFWDRRLSPITFMQNEQFDTPIGGAYAAKVAGTFIEGQKMCWWVGTDVYEECGWRHQPYHCGYGLLNIFGIPKPTAHAHHMAHRLDGGRIVAKYARDGQGFLAVRKGPENLLMFWNFSHPELPERRYTLDLSSAGFEVGRGAKLLQVDARHANGRAAWDRLGRPTELTPRQEAAIRQAAQLVEQPLPLSAVAKQKLVVEPNGFGMIVAASS